MQSTAIIAWVFVSMLTDLVAAAVGVGRISLAALGGHLAGTTLCKHKIKRAWQFCANRRITVAQGMRGLIGRLGRRRGEPLMVALDWVEIRSFHTLMAAAVFGGRALPLL